MKFQFSRWKSKLMRNSIDKETKFTYNLVQSKTLWQNENSESPSFKIESVKCLFILFYLLKHCLEN